MAPIPDYWYVEPFNGGAPFKLVPALMSAVGPEPSTDHIFVSDPATGEIEGEAVLMGALIRPRFGSLFDGKKVVLPFRVAVAFERHEQEILAPLCEALLRHAVAKVEKRALRYRVGVENAEWFTVFARYGTHELGPFEVNIGGSHPPVPSPCAPPARGRGGPSRP